MSFGFISPIRVTSSSQTVTTSVITRVPSSVTNITLVAANANRKGLYLYNDSSATQRVKLGITAAGTDFTVILTRSMFYELPLPLYVGQIDVISSSTNGAIQVTELT